ncbi:MAG: hypothetical protein LIP77_04005 [Planctomycetes bacterium]|nr:hypothetical protein [Planctomycetota bacterium]
MPSDDTRADPGCRNHPQGSPTFRKIRERGGTVRITRRERETIRKQYRACQNQNGHRHSPEPREDLEPELERVLQGL